MVGAQGAPRSIFGLVGFAIALVAVGCRERARAATASTAATGTLSVPIASEFEARATRMFAAGRAPKPEDFAVAWVCFDSTKSGYALLAPPALRSDGDKLEGVSGAQFEKKGGALIVSPNASAGSPGQQAPRRAALRLVEAERGLRLVMELAGVSEGSGTKPGKTLAVSEVLGSQIERHAICVPQKELFGEKAEASFSKFARDSFENGRLPTTPDFSPAWTCLYQPKAAKSSAPAAPAPTTAEVPLVLYLPPPIIVKDGEVFMPHFFGKKRVKMQIADKAWLASLREGDVKAAFRLQRSDEGPRLLQESIGVQPDGHPPMGLGRPPTIYGVCVQTAELGARLFGPGSGAEAKPSGRAGAPGAGNSRVR